MKIAQIIATFPPYHGGMGYICYHNSRVLAERGHQVTVFTLDHGRLTYENDPTTFHIVRLKAPLRYGDAGMVPQLTTRLRNFDILHLHYPFFGGAEYAHLAAIISRKPYFLTYHMDVHGDTPFKKTVIRFYEPLLLKRIVQKASGLCSPGVAYLKSTKAAAFIPWQRHTGVSYGGVETKRFYPRPKNRDLIIRHGLAGKVVILFVGNLIPFKGLHLLIAVVKQITHLPLALLVVGGGYHEMEYKTLVQRENLQERVIFAGPQSPDGLLPDYYNLADFLVLPSTHSESFGLVVLEAMACAKPVIVSSLPGPSQLINPGQDGFIFRTGDVDHLTRKIIALASSEESRLKMGATARRKIDQHYSWEKIGAQLEAAYLKIKKNQQ